MRDRYRGRTTRKAPYTTWIDWTGPGGPGVAGPWVYDNIINHWEEIDDVVRWSTDVKPVLNRSLTVEDFGRPLLHNVYQNNYTESYRNGPVLSYLVQDPSVARQVFPVIPNSFRSACSDEAFEALIPQMPQEVSIPNFLYELREVSDMIPKLEESMAKTVSGGFLTYSFGWKPFVGDLQKLGNLMSQVNRRLDYLRSTYGRETRVTYARKFDASDLGITLLNPQSLGSGASTAGFTKFEGFFRCGGYLYHTLEGLDGFQGTFRGCFAALGLNNPLGVLWEAIPYSFVADWFSNVQEQIQRRAFQPFLGTWEIRHMSHSFRYSFEYESWLGPHPGGVDFPDVPYRQHIQRGEHYQRGRGLPASSLYLTTNDFGPQQQKLAIALLHGLS